MPSETEAILHYSREDSSDVTEIPIPQGDVLIGRAAECDIHLDDQRVSRFHASLKIGPEGFWITDMESTNGTLIDDQPIPPNRRTPLRPLQTFRIGSYLFQVQLPGSAPVEATAVVEEDRSMKTMIQPSAPLPKMYDLKALREAEFPHVMNRTHLDNAATAPLPQRTLKKMNWMLNEKLSNTSWHAGNFPIEMLGLFMDTVAKFINAESLEEITVVDGVSASLNHVAQSLVLQPGDNIIFCDLEHPSNAYAWMSLKRDGVHIKMVPSINGGLTLETVKAAADDRTRVVAASSVQFFTGHRTDLAAIGKYCRERNIIFVVDAIQSVGYTPIDVRQMNIDVLATGGHKSIMAGPCVGFLYVRDAVAATLQPRVITATSTNGWLYYLNYDTSPRNAAGRFLIGTPNAAGVVGILESITLINELTREAIDRHTTNLAAHALEMAKKRGYELTTTPGEHASIATFKSKFDAEVTAPFLHKIEEEQGVAVASHRDRAGHPNLRMSFGCYNVEEDLVRAFDALDKMG